VFCPLLAGPGRLHCRGQALTAPSSSHSDLGGLSGPSSLVTLLALVLLLLGQASDPRDSRNSRKEGAGATLGHVCTHERSSYPQ
jgi:hypothetical protein